MSPSFVLVAWIGVLSLGVVTLLEPLWGSHSIGDNWRLWRFKLRILRHQFRILRFDIRMFLFERSMARFERRMVIFKGFCELLEVHEYGFNRANWRFVCDQIVNSLNEGKQAHRTDLFSELGDLIFRSRLVSRFLVNSVRKFKKSESWQGNQHYQTPVTKIKRAKDLPKFFEAAVSDKDADCTECNARSHDPQPNISNDA